MDRKTFNKRLRRLQRVLIRELMDGCLECKPGCPCAEHGKEIEDMILSPRKSKRLQDEIPHLRKD